MYQVRVDSIVRPARDGLHERDYPFIVAEAGDEPAALHLDVH